MPTYQKPITLHNFYGKDYGLTPEKGISGNDQQIATHSTATADVTLGRTGISALSSNAQTFGMPAPGPNWIGAEKQILSGVTTSTLVRTITSSGCNFMTTSGSSFITATLAGPGQYLNLRAISSALWMVVGTNSSAVLTT